MTHRIIQGDSLSVLVTLPSESINCCVTSPPYFGLRDYGCDGQIGLESTPEAFVARLVAVFREVRRVLRDDGTLWVNMGDSYAGAGYSNHKGTGGTLRENGGKQKHSLATSIGIKHKNLIGMPWRLAFALQADGWYLRQDIIWHKPNPMPESVTDRCTKAHEYVFLMSKNSKYYFDSNKMKEPCNDDMQRRAAKGHTRGTRGRMDKSRNDSNTMRGENAKIIDVSKGRNRRSVWTIATKPYKEAHFAMFPPKLVEPCILAGCPEGGTVLDPFNGSGTTGAVAISHGRNYVGIELNPDYIELTHDRLNRVVRHRTIDLFNGLDLVEKAKGNQ